MAMIGITLVLAVCGGIIAAGRRFLPQGAGGRCRLSAASAFRPSTPSTC